MLTPIHWTIDGTPVQLARDWSAQTVANRGFDQMRGSMTEASWRKLTGSGQGSVIVGYTDACEVVWEGRLATTPQIVAGQARFAAQGYYIDAERKDDRLFVQSKDMGIWTALDGEPFVNTAGASYYDTSPRIDVDTGNRIAYTIGKDDSIAVGVADGAGFWAEGVNLQRIAFTMAYSTNMEGAGLRVRLQRATGPSGSATTVNTFSLTSGNNGTEKDQTLGTVDDLLMLSLDNTGSTFSSTNTAKMRLSRVRVNSDITTSDTFHAYQIVDYIGDQLGWDTSDVTASTFNALPFDWQGGDWAEAASYLAELEDHHWGVYESTATGPRLVYQSWGYERLWNLSVAGGAEVDLTPQAIYNKALVWFETPTGKTRSVTATASPDPLSGTGITNTIEADLLDRQADSTMASNVASKLISRFSRQRYAGKVSLIHGYQVGGAGLPGAAGYASGFDNPHGIRPGDLATITDWGPAEALQLRVVDVTIRPDRVELGLENPVNLTWLLRHVTRPSRRRRPR